jgi:hypothetical protein
VTVDDAVAALDREVTRFTFKPYTKTDFLEWLRFLPPDTTFCDGSRTETCPIAKFTGRRAIKHDEANPEWANTFMERYDARISRSLADALTIAETL